MEAIPVHCLKCYVPVALFFPVRSSCFKGLQCVFKSPNWKSQQADNYQQNVREYGRHQIVLLCPSTAVSTKIRRLKDAAQSGLMLLLSSEQLPTCSACAAAGDPRSVVVR